MDNLKSLGALIYLVVIITILIFATIFMRDLQSKLNEERALNETLLLNIKMMQDDNEMLMRSYSAWRVEAERMGLKLELIEGAKEITLEAIVTAYAPNDNQSGICADENPLATSTGRKPGKAYAAADPTRIPYGTIVYIPGYGEVEIQDTGGNLRADKENLRIDVYFDSHDEAIQWGRKNLDVRIVL